MGRGPQRFGGESGGARTTVLLSGSPFATLAALESYSQANPDELFNNPEQVAMAVVNADPDSDNNGTYEYAGPNLSYAAGRWVMFSGLNAEDIKNLYESNPDTNAFTNSDSTTVSSVQSVADGTIPVIVSGQATEAGLRRMSSGAIRSDNPIEVAGAGAITIDFKDLQAGGDISGGATGLLIRSLSTDLDGYMATSLYDGATGSTKMFYDVLGATHFA